MSPMLCLCMYEMLYAAGLMKEYCIAVARGWMVRRKYRYQLKDRTKSAITIQRSMPLFTSITHM